MQSRLELAESNARRFTDLRRQGFVTQEAADSRQHEVNAARTALAAAQANRDAAGQERERLLAEQAAAMKLRANSQLRSPVAGLVIARDAEPGSTVVAGQSVLQLIDPASLWLRVRIDPGPFQWAARRTARRDRAALRPDERFPGQVTRVELIGDSVTEEKMAYVSFAHRPDDVALGELAEITLRLPALPVAGCAQCRSATARRAGRVAAERGEHGALPGAALWHSVIWTVPCNCWTNRRRMPASSCTAGGGHEGDAVRPNPALSGDGR